MQVRPQRCKQWGIMCYFSFVRNIVLLVGNIFIFPYWEYIYFSLLEIYFFSLVRNIFIFPCWEYISFSLLEICFFFLARIYFVFLVGNLFLFSFIRNIFFLWGKHRFFSFLDMYFYSFCMKKEEKKTFTEYQNWIFFTFPKYVILRRIVSGSFYLEQCLFHEKEKF